MELKLRFVIELVLFLCLSWVGDYMNEELKLVLGPRLLPFPPATLAVSQDAFYARTRD